MNNQQFPCFLNKTKGNKVVILIDPILEMPLKTEQLFQEMGDPLILVNSEFKDEKTYFRELRIKSDSVTIFAIIITMMKKKNVKIIQLIL